MKKAIAFIMGMVIACSVFANGKKEAKSSDYNIYLLSSHPGLRVPSADPSDPW